MALRKSILIITVLHWGIFANGDAPVGVLTVKPNIEIQKIADRYIDLPNEVGGIPISDSQNYGNNLFSKLIETLITPDSGVIILGQDNLNSIESKQKISDPILIQSKPIASAKVTVEINELSFTVGSRGNKVLYGFKKGFENNFNSGLESQNRNEFPILGTSFEQEFKDEQNKLRTGLDLSNEINFDLKYAGADIKYALFRATFGVKVTVSSPFLGIHTRNILATAQGFFLDMMFNATTQYGNFRGGIILGRKAALKKAYESIMPKIISAIQEDLVNIPLVTELVLSASGDLYIPVGSYRNIKSGDFLYSSVDPKNEFIVEEVFQNISRVRPIDKNRQTSGELIFGKPQNKISTKDSSNKYSIFNSEITTDLGIISETPIVQNSSVDSAFLPYRIFRFFQYDQKYRGKSKKQKPNHLVQALKTVQNNELLNAIGIPLVWKKYGLGSAKVAIAVIDSGVDYNHSELKNQIYIDDILKSPGFDFVSHDDKPYDDFAHGTEVASAIAGYGMKMVGVAPEIKILPIKIFSPYGETSSAWIQSAFEYAIQAGAKIIVTAWESSVRSKALEEGIRLAESKGIMVVAAAGDKKIGLLQEPQFPASFAQNYSNLVVVQSLGKNVSTIPTSNFGAEFGFKILDYSVARPRNEYARVSHSGVAAGIMAGIIGLGASICESKTLSISEIKNFLMSSSEVSSANGIEVREVIASKYLDRVAKACNLNAIDLH